MKLLFTQNGVEVELGTLEVGFDVTAQLVSHQHLGPLIPTHNFSMSEATTLTKEISPPPRKKRKDRSALLEYPQRRPESRQIPEDQDGTAPSLAAVEAGEAEVADHLAYFATHLALKSRAEPRDPRISVEEFKNLYQRNQHAKGRHFVVHQHNHPVSGVHCKLLR